MWYVLSLWLAMPIGLGWLVWWPCRPRLAERPLVQELPLVAICGLALNLVMLLLFRRLSLCNGLTTAGTVVGWAGLAFHLWRHPQRGAQLRAMLIALPVAAAWLFPIAVAALLLPLREWDARSIWFFHAKIIYYEGALSQSSPWTIRLLSFAHTDYPKLVSSLAAQVAWSAGYWNEYIPKLALVVILEPIVLGLIAQCRRPVTALLFLLPFIGHARLDFGNMDSQLACLFCLGLLYWVRYCQGREPIDLLTGAAFLLLTPSLKNEGDLMVALAVASLGLGALWLWRQHRLRPALAALRPLRPWLVLLPPLVAAWQWHHLKTAWHLTNDLALGSTATIKRGLNRLFDPEPLSMLGHFTSENTWTALLAIAVALVAAVAIRRRFPWHLLPLLVISAVYGLGVCTIYLITPYPLHWHLASSSGRTFIPVCMAAWFAVVLLLEWLQPDDARLAAPTA